MPDYMILINEDTPMPQDFESTVDFIHVENSEGNKYQIERKTYEAFLRLQKDLLENDGIRAELISVYRSVAQQHETVARYMRDYGPEYTKKYVAVPGCSEHHTGLAIDVGIVVDGKLLRKVDDLLSVNHLFKIIQGKLAKYGFILRYPADKEAITKIAYESWHFRYIDSPEIAREITEKGICFEEYWQNI